MKSIEVRGSRFTVSLPAVSGPVSTLPLTPSNDLPLRRVLVACTTVKKRASSVRLSVVGGAGGARGG